MRESDDRKGAEEGAVVLRRGGKDNARRSFFKKRNCYADRQTARVAPRRIKLLPCMQLVGAKKLSE